MKNTIKWNQVKKYLIIFLIITWAIMLIVGFLKSPTSGQSAENFLTMKDDITYLLKNGGKVVSSTDLLKYGRADVSRHIAVEGWSTSLMLSYEKSLSERGWVKFADGEYCKNGIFAKIIGNSGMLDGKEVNLIEMTFDGLTLEKCGVVGKSH